MLRIQCPACQQPFTIREPKEGQFRPSCRNCSAVFELTINADKTTYSIGRWKAPGNSAERAAAHPPETKAYRTAKPPAADDDGTRLDPVAIADRNKADHASSATRMESGGQEVSSEPDTNFVLSKTKTARYSRPDSSASVTRVDAEATRADSRANSVLGGYRLVRELGRGGLGVVYLARQLSLHRNVAVKLIQSKIAARPAAVSRFIREAYAAAQLVHPNVVQIYDLGQDGNTSYFSMEFVQGRNLAELLRDKGPLPARQAAGFVLQAARGLRFVHDQGMVHRDVKPANLMLDQHGVVKVADLGLVKVPAMNEEPVEGSAEGAWSGAIELTGAGATLGTVNYISPEQATASSEVDHRADIYSLGCTLFALLTGRPPFQGSTAEEILAAHRTLPVPRPESLVPGVDRALGDIVVKMMEKRPELRYSHLGEAIRDLENFLGIRSGNSFVAAPAHLQVLADSQKAYYSLPLAHAGAWIPPAFFGTGLVLAVILLFVSIPWAMACLAGLVIAPATAFLLSGFRQQGIVFEKVRQVAARGGWKHWIMVAAVFLILFAVVYALGMIGPWLLVSTLAAGLGAAWHFVIERGLARERFVALEPVQQFLREQRAAGVGEETLRSFVARSSGGDWEEFFEDLFGYEALQAARADLAANPAGPRRKRHGRLRDAFLARLERRLDEVRKIDDVRKLRAIEQQALVASGVPESEAEAQAEAASRFLVEEAERWRKEARSNSARQATSAPLSAAEEKRARFKAMMAQARGGAAPRTTRPLAALEGPLDLALGAHVRLLLGALLVAGCAMWIHKNGLVSEVSIESLSDAGKALASGNTGIADLASTSGVDTAKPREDLSWPIIGGWVSNFNAGAAGLLLVASALFGGWRTSLIVLPLAAAIWLGPVWFGLPGLFK